MKYVVPPHLRVLLERIQQLECDFCNPDTVNRNVVSLRLDIVWFELEHAPTYSFLRKFIRV